MFQMQLLLVKRGVRRCRARRGVTRVTKRVRRRSLVTRQQGVLVTQRVTLAVLTHQQLLQVMAVAVQPPPAAAAAVTHYSHQMETHHQPQQWMTSGYSRTAARAQSFKPSAGSKGRWPPGACRH
jgi:hypothetical protein